MLPTIQKMEQPSIVIGTPPALKSMVTGAGEKSTLERAPSTNGKSQSDKRMARFRYSAPTPPAGDFGSPAGQRVREAVTAILSLRQPALAKP